MTLTAKGCSFTFRASHIQEQVAEGRELNSTEAWLEVASTVNPLCQSLPLLLHHQVRAADIRSIVCLPAGRKSAITCFRMPYNASTYLLLAM